jgi:hypothetical protein
MRELPQLEEDLMPCLPGHLHGLYISGSPCPFWPPEGYVLVHFHPVRSTISIARDSGGYMITGFLELVVLVVLPSLYQNQPHRLPMVAQAISLLCLRFSLDPRRASQSGDQRRAKGHQKFQAWLSLPVVATDWNDGRSVPDELGRRDNRALQASWKHSVRFLPIH